MNFLENSFVYLAPIVGTIVAILGLFADRQARSFKIIAPAIILATIVLTIFQISESKKAQIEEADAAKRAKTESKRFFKLLDDLASSSARTSSYLSSELLSQDKILGDFGLTEKRVGKELRELSMKDLENSEILIADQYRSELIAKRPPSHRKGVKVWYYNKEVDNPQLSLAMEEMGFEVTNLIAKRNQAEDLTNAVWYGPGVALEDYKAVIINLIRAGVDVQRTGPACNDTLSKHNVIEIGSSDEAAGRTDGLVRPTKSVLSIQNAKSFKDLDDFVCPQ